MANNMKGVFPMNQRTGIYKIINPDNDVYIGGTRNFVNRLATYRNAQTKTQPLLDMSIKKYGWGNHVFSVVHNLPSDISQDILDKYEQLYMDFYKNTGHSLLNLKSAGKNGKHGQLTMEKYKIGSRSGEKHHFYGKKLTEEHRKKLCVEKPSLKGRVFSNETLLKMSLSRIGKKHSDADRKKMSEARKGGKNINAKRVIDTQTGIIYDFVGDAAKASGYSRAYLSGMLCGLSKNNSTLRYL